VKETLQKTADGGAVHTMQEGEQQFAVNLSASVFENMVMKAIQLAKEPDEETKEKLAKEKAARAEYMKGMMQAAEQEQQARKNAQEHCSHKKPDGSSRVHAGQVYSDGKIRPMCVWCQKIFKEYDAPRELMGGQGF